MGRACFAVALVFYAVATLLAFDVFGSADVLDVLGCIAFGLAFDALGKLA